MRGGTIGDSLFIAMPAQTYTAIYTKRTDETGRAQR